MKNITYISASAGSGKTYAITTKLADIIKEKKAEPEQAILTTFTKAAAAELKEKAKAKLCENGLYEQAERLEQAMIGTAHSVAESFIKKYWHILGLSPELNVMTDEDVDFYRNQSLYTVPTGKELSFLHDFAEEFGIKYKFGSGKYGINYDFWKDHLKTIIEYSINYGITDYEKSREESENWVKKLCEAGLKRENLPDDEEIKKKFNELLEYDRQVAQNKNAKSLDERKDKVFSIIRHNTLTLVDLYNLSDIFPGKVKDKDPNLFENLAKIMNTEDARDLQLEYIDIIFAIARRWKESFEQYKKEKRLIDYSDMEKYFVLLLENEEVKKDIKAKYKYLFVDEFQDSSPIQIKFFEALADIMEGGSYWVGDFKQSIYGFRGTDTALVKAVADKISRKHDGCQMATLDTSHRSLPELVNAVNEIFVPVFGNILPDKNQIALKPYKDLEEEESKLKRKKTEWHSLRFLPLSGGNKEQRSCDLAKYIAGMIQGGENPKNIAIIAKKNDILTEIAKWLKQYGIPVRRKENKTFESNECQLVSALLALTANTKDSLARTKVAYFAAKGYDPGEIINARLSDNDKINDNYLENLPIIKKITEKAEFYRTLSVKAITDLIITELDLAAITKKWPGNANSKDVFNAMSVAAGAYEDHCLKLAIPATIYGFLEYIEEKELETSGDPNGVSLFTYHGSKGLEWKNVILLSLEDEPIKEDDIIKEQIYGIRFIRQKPSEDNLFPETSIRVLPWIYGSKEKVSDKTKELLKKIQGYEDIPQSETAKSVLEESKRLMYVGMTRASHCLILATQTKNLSKDEKSERKKAKRENELDNRKLMLAWLKQIGIDAISEIGSVNDKSYDLLGINMPFYTETVPEMENWQYNPQNTEFTVKAENAPAAYPLRDCQPSAVPGSPDTAVKIIYPENYSAGTETARINLKNVSADEMAETGSCIHDIFCVLEYINGEARNAKADAIIQDYGFAGKIAPEQPEQVVRAWDNLAKLLSEKYGRAAATYHELPFQYAKEGQIFTGSIDYVYELPENKVILVDYKSFPGRIEMITDKDDEDKKGEKGTHYAGKYKGQFDCYEHALTAAGKTVIAKIIYYPVAGIAVQIKDVEH
jgi:ATP-dependent exoDNAse (exonuclease V) beta subunit